MSLGLLAIDCSIWRGQIERVCNKCSIVDVIEHASNCDKDIVAKAQVYFVLHLRILLYTIGAAYAGNSSPSFNLTPTFILASSCHSSFAA